MSTTPIGQVSAIEREARRRIDDANARVTAVQQEAAQAVDRVRDEYKKQYENESVREEAALENQRLKGYESLRNLQNQQQTDLRKTRRIGETDLSQLQTYYNDRLRTAEQTSEQQLNEVQTTSSRNLDFQRKIAAEQELDIQNKHAERMGYLRESGEAEAQRVRTTNQLTLDELKSRYAFEEEKTQAHLEESFQNKQIQAKQLLQEIESNASQKLGAIRRDTADKLAAYATRQQDPFYRLMSPQATLTDAGDEYVLTAKIPIHEQQHIAATVKGDNLVISGYRRNEERMDLGAGHTQNSAAYQSFQESFPLSWPVDSKRLSREFREDEVIIRVPKKNDHAFLSPKTELPEKARLDFPQFPENLPIGQKLSQKSTEDVRPQGQSSRTLL